ncbi:MAG TPA: hypothetical protein VM286_10690 [Candidatus Thermoplasmatota archaeon]|nr:hypothetical protein [Candidatus Thermoplasmatota archaeon]
MTMRRMQALDVPAAEIERMKQALAPRYGSELWDPDGQALLVVRVPRDEPDLVNDLEGAVEYLAPADVQHAKVTLLVGNQKSHIVPTPTLQGLMEARTALDKAEADRARRSLKPGQHQVFQAPTDPRRLQRLALRIHAAKVADVTEAHLAPFVASLGPLLRSPELDQVRAVHLVAEGDDVRLDADLFFQDLEEKWHEEQERRALAGALASQQAARAEAVAAELAAKQAAVREALPSPPPPFAPLAAQRPPGLTATAPLRHHGSVSAWDASQVAPLPAFLPPTPPAIGMGDVFEVGDPVPPRPVASSASPTSAASPASPRPAAAAKAPPAWTPNPAVLAWLEKRLKTLGFDTLGDPGRHGIAMAAERDGFPSRVIVFQAAALDLPMVERVLSTAKAVAADQALVVCETADPEARRRLIATRVKWVTPGEIPSLDL